MSEPFTSEEIEQVVWRLFATIDARNAENARLREQAEALADALQRVRSIILSVENRCMAADGPVTPTLEEMTEDELRAIWQASDAALRSYRGATPEGDDEYGLAKAAEQVADRLPPGWKL